MLFGVRLANEIYPPWRGQYIAYDRLKKLLREDETEPWSDNDETRFVTALDEELERVYSFETTKYTELSDSVSKWEDKVKNASASITDHKEMELNLESILEETNHLDNFSRLNYTGFQKIVKKHDRLHTNYQVKPLLHVRLNALPFHNEDYSPLLYRLSSLYGFLSENFGLSENTNSASIRMSSFQGEGGADNEYTSARFWVHPDNMMEVKTRILRHLPVLVYNNSEQNGTTTGNNGSGQGEQIADPRVTSEYFDNDEFELYESQLERTRTKTRDTTNGDQNSGYLPSLRLRWYGELGGGNNNSIQLERKDAEGSIKLKEKNVQPFLSGDRAVIDKTIRKLKAKYSSQNDITAQEKRLDDLQSYIKDHKLEPVLHTVYTRTAFQIPGDDNVRILMDSDISFSRAKGHNQNDTADNSYSSKFPFCVLEIRLKARTRHAPWIDDLMSSHLVKEVPLFSKFVHGIASIFAEDDRLDALPFWLPELENDIRQDPEVVYKEQKNRVQRHKDELSKKKVAASPTPAESGGETAATPAAAKNTEDYSSDDDDDGESSSSSSITRRSRKKKSKVGYPTWTSRRPKLDDQDSEEEEVELPPGVQKPRNLLRFSGEVKVETKVWLANERTFNKWLSITTMLSALTFALYNSVKKSHSQATAEKVAYILFALTVFTGIWGYITYIRRLRFIRQRSERHLDAPLGPLVLSITLIIALSLNFYTSWKYHKEILPGEGTSSI